MQEGLKKKLIIAGAIGAGLLIFIAIVVTMALVSKMDPLPAAVTDSFKGIQIAFVVIMALASLIMIIAVLASPPQTGVGSNVITGAAESFYTKNRGKNNQGRLKMLVIICAATIAICAILYFVAYSVYPASSPEL